MNVYLKITRKCIAIQLIKVINNHGILAETGGKGRNQKKCSRSSMLKETTKKIIGIDIFNVKIFMPNDKNVKNIDYKNYVML